MPKGPQGQKRPADAIGCAVHVARIATGEAEEEVAYVASTSERASAGGKARAQHLSEGERSEIAKAGAAARWKERSKKMTGKICDPLSGLLFGQGEPSLVNLKMLRGDANVTEEELRAEAHSAIAQVRLNRSKRLEAFPEDNSAHRVNVNELASRL